MMKNESDIQTIYNPMNNVRSHPNPATNREIPPIRAASRDGSYHSVESADLPREETQELVGKKGGCKDKLCKFRHACCSPPAKKIYCGIWVTVCITASWVASTHFIKYLFHSYALIATLNGTMYRPYFEHMEFYNAPFFTTWFCTNWMVLFFPIYYLAQLASSRALTPTEILCESVRNFRNSRFTAGRFLIRCSFFCILWVLTNYMYVYSLRILLATDVIALFATNVVYVYLLSWVILHEQFVGLRIVAIILCDTGVALLVYMDGISQSSTMNSVLLAATAAVGFAVYKILFKKTFGEVSLGQISLFFSLIGMLNATLLWPLCLVLYFTGVEVLQWDRLPWTILFGASLFSLITNLLGNFSFAITYDLFITLGLITSVPVSAALDVVLYGTHFYGMKLAGIILISIGFFLVMFPDNWPDYITRLLRNIILMSRNARVKFNVENTDNIQVNGTERIAGHKCLIKGLM
ncbi:solute carrier family 35 member F3 isoform X2 [Planococcus citri]|uniref:solute carrier family 35 member F3 isoform X2 n=1 Tax=Planococcus citri TaxID=170843 RepID=UPI0031F85A37